MSWSVNYPSRLAFARDEPVHRSSAIELPGEAREQFMAARMAAGAMLASSAMGETARDVVVHLSGHANPGHRPVPKIALDCIGIYIGQKVST